MSKQIPNTHGESLKFSLIVPPDFRIHTVHGFESSLVFDKLWFAYRTLFIQFISSAVAKAEAEAAFGANSIHDYTLVLPLLSTGLRAGELRLQPELMMNIQAGALARAVQSLSRPAQVDAIAADGVLQRQSSSLKYSSMISFPDEVLQKFLFGRVKIYS